MAPLGYRVVEHGIYCMPFFINPTAAGKTECKQRDIALLLSLIPFAYPHTKSSIRPFVEVRHAWYGEHNNRLGSFSEFRFVEAMTPKRNGNPEVPSVDTAPFEEQYVVPKQLSNDLNDKVVNFLDLCEELPPWCKENGHDATRHSPRDAFRPSPTRFTSAMFTLGPSRMPRSPWPSTSATRWLSLRR